MARRLIGYGALVAAIGAIAVIALVEAGGALAYGKADAPIAQVEISANCNNPAFPMCQQVGLGGVWTWAELDTTNGNTESGTMDYTLAFCGHTGPGGGPHSAGAFGHPGTGKWWRIEDLSDAPQDAFPFFDPGKYDGSQGYYVLDFEDGGPEPFMAVVPAVYGHYSNPGFWPAGAQFQTQVAP